MTESIRDMKPEETISAKKESVHLLQFETKEPEKQIDTSEPEIQQDIATLQKPVDLYKVLILSSTENEIIYTYKLIHGYKCTVKCMLQTMQRPG